MLKLKVFLTLVCVFFVAVLFAQIPNLPSNLSNIRSSEINDEQVKQVAQYMRSNNVSGQMGYDQLLQRGMSAGEAMEADQILLKPVTATVKNTCFIIHESSIKSAYFFTRGLNKRECSETDLNSVEK